MTGAGFHEPQKFRPTGLAVVVALHAAALGALVLIKGPVGDIAPPVRTIVDFIPLPTDPPVDPPPPVETDNMPPQPTEFTAPPDVIERTSGPVTTQEPPRQAEFADAGTAIRDIPDLPPVRLEALFDPRFAVDQQPPYPPSELRDQRDGRVRLRVTIGADGRVKAVQRLSATSDAFWRSTERHALDRWRFRPATVDGRPVESTKVLTITFQIEV